MLPVKHPRPFDYLEELAKRTSYDPQRTLKDQVRAIDALRDWSEASQAKGDLENAYIYLGRAATVIKDHLPHHPQYHSLTVQQHADLANVRLSTSLCVY